MRNGYFGIGISIAIIIAIGIGFNLFGGVILFFTYGSEIKNGAPSVIILVNALSQVLFMIGLPMLIARAQEKDFFSSFRMEGMSETKLGVHLLGIPIIFVSQYFGQGLVSLWSIGLSHFPDLYSGIQSFQKQMDDMMNGLTTAKDPAELAILLFGVALIPAFAEESFFRGFIQTNIERSGKGRSRPYSAIIITSVFFAAMHVNPIGFPGLLVIGLILGYLAYRSSDLRVSALAHAFNNGLIVILIYLTKDNPEFAESLAGSPVYSLSESMTFIAVSAPVLFGLLYLFHKMTEPIEARGNAQRIISDYERTRTEFSN